MIKYVLPVSRRERDVQHALCAAVGADGRRSGHLRGVHHVGVGHLAIIGRLRAVVAARRALGTAAALSAGGGNRAERRSSVIEGF